MPETNLMVRELDAGDQLDVGELDAGDQFDVGELDAGDHLDVGDQLFVGDQLCSGDQCVAGDQFEDAGGKFYVWDQFNVGYTSSMPDTGLMQDIVMLESCHKLSTFLHASRFHIIAEVVRTEMQGSSYHP